LISLNFIGTEFKTTACTNTGVMRHTEIQQGKDGMKMQQFNNQVGATAGCTLRALLGTIPPDEKDKRFGIRGDAWFGSVRAANEVALGGQEAGFQIKTYHSSFPKDFIEATLKDAPGGVYVPLEGVTKDEIKLVAIGYRYSRKTILHFVDTRNAGSTALGATMIAINVTDTYLLANYHKLINYSPTSDDDKTEKIGIKRFAGILAFQLIEMGKKLTSGPLKFLEEDVIEVKTPFLVDGKTDFHPLPCKNLQQK
jgi:hypothetical protein